MSTKFANITLGRAFRPVVLAHLKGLAQWPDYRSLMGFNGCSEGMTNAEVKSACEALGVDLEAMWLAFDGQLVGPAPASNAAEDARYAAEVEAHTAAMAQYAAGVNAPAMAHAAPAEGEGEAWATGAPASGPSYEGGDVDALLADALAPAAVHLTPYVMGVLPGLIRPFIEAAVRGPRVETVTVHEVETVTVGDDGGVNTRRSVMTRDARVVKRIPLWQAFGLRKGSGGADYRVVLDTLMVDVCDYADAPAVDPDYVWNVDALCQIAAQDACRLNGWLYGPAGTGKTEGMRQYAARLGRPFVRIPIERTTEPSELIGQEGLAKGGGMSWRDGKLTRAFRMPHCVVLIDEPTLLRSGTLSAISTALDTREINTVCGETIIAAPGVFVCAADNTAGTGDETGRYVDTSALNVAFLDRFALRTEMTWLPVVQETSMIAARVGLAPAAVRHMVDYASTTRANATSGKLTIGLTTRRILAWARVVKVGLPSAVAFRAAVLDVAAAEDRPTLELLANASLTSLHDRIDGIARGTIDPNVPGYDPKAQGGVGATALQFPDDNQA